MPKKKFKHKPSWLSLIKKTTATIKRNKQTKKELLEECRNGFSLSGEDKITYVYMYRDSRGGRNIIEIICVSYEIYVANSWKTVIYYDDAHKQFHKHVMISLDDTKGEISTSGVRQKGGRKKLLTWAIDDLINNYLYYKKEFLKRNADLLT